MAPVFFLAFAYSPKEALPEIVNELKNLAEIFRNTGVAPIVSWQVTQNEIEQQFDINLEQLRIFHFSGHAWQNASNSGQYQSATMHL